MVSQSDLLPITTATTAFSFMVLLGFAGCEWDFFEVDFGMFDRFSVLLIVLGSCCELMTRLVINVVLSLRRGRHYRYCCLVRWDLYMMRVANDQQPLTTLPF